ncbi:hypothetical protein ACFLTH_09435, partial [Bacteroidota bacterium]
MLKIAKSVEYAILGLKYIAENSHDKVVSTAEMSQELDMPYNLLAKIMQKLVINLASTSAFYIVMMIANKT